MPRETVSYEHLLAYAAGELGPEDTDRVAAYVEGHAEAAATVARYRLARQRVAGDDSVEPPAQVVAEAKRILSAPKRSNRPSWLDLLDEFVATLVFDSRVQPMAVRFAPGDERIQLAFETERAEVDLQARRVTPHAKTTGEERWQVDGQLSANLPSLSVDIVLLSSESGEAIAEGRADDQGYFTFEASTGRYDLCLRMADQIIVLPGLEIL